MHQMYPKRAFLSQKCSLAEKLKSFERGKIDYSDLYVDESEVIDSNRNDQSYIPALKTPEHNSDMEQSSRHLSPSRNASLHTPVLPNNLRLKQKENQFFYFFQFEPL